MTRARRRKLVRLVVVNRTVGLRDLPPRQAAAVVRRIEQYSAGALGPQGRQR